MSLPKIPGGLESISLGQLGADYINNTNQRNGDWCVITAITDATFDALLSSTISLNGAAIPAAGSDLVGEILYQGLSLYGRFSRITLASGKVIAYRSGTTPTT